MPLEDTSCADLFVVAAMDLSGWMVRSGEDSRDVPMYIQNHSHSHSSAQNIKWLRLNDESLLRF